MLSPAPGRWARASHCTCPPWRTNALAGRSAPLVGERAHANKWRTRPSLCCEELIFRCCAAEQLLICCAAASCRAFSGRKQKGARRCRQMAPQRLRRNNTEWRCCCCTGTGKSRSWLTFVRASLAAALWLWYCWRQISAAHCVYVVTWIADKCVRVCARAHKKYSSASVISLKNFRTEVKEFTGADTCAANYDCSPVRLCN